MKTIQELEKAKEQWSLTEDVHSKQRLKKFILIEAEKLERSGGGECLYLLQRVFG